MSKVGAGIGLTLKLFKDEKTFEMIKPNLEIVEIVVNSEGSVDDQIEASIIALRKVYKKVTEEMQTILDEQFKQIAKEIKSGG